MPSRLAQVQTKAISEVGRRPKLLFLAYHFPPAQTIASVRTWNVAKYLARLGWDVTVVTPAPSVWQHAGNAETTKADLAKEGIRQILTDHHWRFLASEQRTRWNEGLGWYVGGACRRIARHLGIGPGVGWIKAAERACVRLGPQDVDLIFASGPPFAAFALAERLSKKLARPYVLDYRDPWPYEVSGMIQALRPLVNRLEAKLLAGSAAVTIVTPSWGFDLDSRFKVGSKLHVITNGYDPEELKDVKPHDFGHFAIVYAGIFYPPERVITPVLAALKRLETKSSSCQYYFHYYGDHDRHVRDEAVRLGVADRVRLHGRVPRSEVLSAIRGASIAVVISSVFEERSLGIRPNIVPGKLFEAIGLGAPILLIAPPGSDAESIAEPTRLARRFTGDDIDGIASFFEQQILGSTFKKKTVDSLEWESLANRLDRVLRKVLV
jgi:glycosyltransferase involved in cell wall biosynthesis